MKPQYGNLTKQKERHVLMLWNMNVTVIPVINGVLGTVP